MSKTYLIALLAVVAAITASAQSGAPDKVTVNASDQTAARGATKRQSHASSGRPEKSPITIILKPSSFGDPVSWASHRDRSERFPKLNSNRPTINFTTYKSVPQANHAQHGTALGIKSSQASLVDSLISLPSATDQTSLTT